MLDIEAIDVLIVSTAAQMTYKQRLAFGQHLKDLADDFLALPEEATTAEKMQEYISKQKE